MRVSRLLADFSSGVVSPFPNFLFVRAREGCTDLHEGIVLAWEVLTGTHHHALLTARVIQCRWDEGYRHTRALELPALPTDRIS